MIPQIGKQLPAWKIFYYYRVLIILKEVMMDIFKTKENLLNKSASL